MCEEKIISQESKLLLKFLHYEHTKKDSMLNSLAMHNKIKSYILIKEKIPFKWFLKNDWNARMSKAENSGIFHMRNFLILLYE